MSRVNESPEERRVAGIRVSSFLTCGEAGTKDDPSTNCVLKLGIVMMSTTGNHEHSKNDLTHPHSHPRQKRKKKKTQDWGTSNMLVCKINTKRFLICGWNWDPGVIFWVTWHYTETVTEAPLLQVCSWHTLIWLCTGLKVIYWLITKEMYPWIDVEWIYLLRKGRFKSFYSTMCLKPYSVILFNREFDNVFATLQSMSKFSYDFLSNFFLTHSVWNT